MTVSEIVGKLRQQPFEPFDIVTSSGQRYPVLHLEFAHVTPRGAIYIFQPTQSDDATGESPDVVSVLHVTAIEPLRKHPA